MEDFERKVLVQNSLTTDCPAFATHPHWYICGQEKKVKIGTKSFNYIDFLEAWHHHDCNTHRQRWVLDKIRDRIADAFREVEEHNRPKNIK